MKLSNKAIMGKIVKFGEDKEIGIATDGKVIDIKIKCLAGDSKDGRIFRRRKY